MYFSSDLLEFQEKKNPKFSYQFIRQKINTQNTILNEIKTATEIIWTRKRIEKQIQMCV